MKKMSNLSLRPRCSVTGALGCLAVAVAAFLLDQLSKRAIVDRLALGESTEGIPGLFRLTYVQNTGMAWSMLSGHTGLLALISLITILGLSLFLLYGRLCPQARYSLALVLGGAAGNLLDRSKLGYVVDMIDLSFMSYPVFNVGDSFIVVGGILFALLYLFYNDHWLATHGILPAPEEKQ